MPGCQPATCGGHACPVASQQPHCVGLAGCHRHGNPHPPTAAAAAVGCSTPGGGAKPSVLGQVHLAHHRRGAHLPGILRAGAHILPKHHSQPKANHKYDGGSMPPTDTKTAGHTIDDRLCPVRIGARAARPATSGQPLPQALWIAGWHHLGSATPAPGKGFVDGDLIGL